MLGRSLMMKAGGAFDNLWTPARIATALWLDSSDAGTITQSAGLISQVNDKSGNNRNFTATSGARPTYSTNVLNGLAVFTYSGSQWLTSANAASTWNFLHQNGGAETIGVWKAGNIADPNTLYGFWGTNAGSVTNIGIYQRWDDRAASAFDNALVLATRVGDGLSNVLDISANGVHPANSATIIGATFDLGSTTAADKVRHIVNGTVLAGTNTSTIGGNAGNAAFTLQIGATGNNVWPLTGYIAEFLAFNSKLSTVNRQLLEGYLAHKWGLAASLPVDHPYKNAAPTV
jgi:hypothetical protein